MSSALEAGYRRSVTTFDCTLSELERAEVTMLVEHLLATPPALIDDRGWLDMALLLSSRLPTRLREVIRAYRNDPGPDGTLVLRGLPIDAQNLPLTPMVPESVERESTVPAVVSVLITLNLGEIAAYRDEKSGALVQNVVPVPGKEAAQSNAGSVPLQLHVENAFHPCRPDFVTLLCLRSDRLSSVGTLVSSVRRALNLLDAATLRTLRQNRFVTQRPHSFGNGGESPAHAVLEGDPADPNATVDFHATKPLDDGAKIALDRLQEAFIESVTAVPLRPGDMVVVDNRIVVHGRSGFTPRYDGYDRWLHRTFAHLDNRRTRAYRRGDGPVLT